MDYVKSQVTAKAEQAIVLEKSPRVMHIAIEKYAYLCMVIQRVTAKPCSILKQSLEKRTFTLNNVGC